jgi:phage shock protein C
MYRLYRSRRDRMLAGVAGGLAELWGADPSLVRVIWALLVIFTGGVALIVYIVMALVVPEEPDIAATGGAQAFAGTAPPGSGEGWVPPADAQAARLADREARAAARSAAGGDRNTFPAATILGGFLVILGGFFLAREFLPQIDFDWFWPLVIVGIGILLIVSAARRQNPPG